MAVSIDSRRVHHLRVAVDEGSLTLAAKTLGISQPALSMSIRSLELDLGVTLLTRYRHGVRPTAFADILAASSRTIEAELGHAATRLSQLKLSTASMVGIGCGPSESSRLLPMALLLLRRTHPEIRVIVEYGLNESLMPLVANGDIAFALSSVPRHSMHPDLKQQPLLVDAAVVVARVGHPLARRRKVAVRDLAAYPWVLARRWELERNALDQLFTEAGVDVVEPAIETTSDSLMKAIVAQSDFLTFVPREMIHWEERARLLRPLNAVHSGWRRQVGLTTRRGTELPEAARHLVTCLRETVAALTPAVL